MVEILIAVFAAVLTISSALILLILGAVEIVWRIRSRRYLRRIRAMERAENIWMGTGEKP